MYKKEYHYFRPGTAKQYQILEYYRILFEAKWRNYTI